IERKTAAFDPGKFKSHYMGALRDLIEEKRKKGKVTAATDEELGDTGSNVIDLMDALRRSVAKRGGETKTHQAGPSPRRKTSGKGKAAARKAARQAGPERKAGGRHGHGTRRRPIWTGSSHPAPRAGVWRHGGREPVGARGRDLPARLHIVRFVMGVLL